MKLSTLPTKIHTGINCVANTPAAFSNITRAFIVTGKHGAAASGALDDVTSVLKKTNAEYLLFDRIPENPPAELCREGGALARDFGADTVIAIGGGSALDGAKAVASYAANPTENADSIFDPRIITRPGLPLIAIPTTAGTGSEVNSFAILTIEGGRKKRTFKNQWSTPERAFLDPKYTASLPRDYTLSCALDALAHCFESYLSPKSTGETRALCTEGAKLIWQTIFGEPSPGDRDHAGFTMPDRDALLRAANYAGQAIGVTGTGFPHPLGYNLTMAKGVPHGRACAAFYSEYIRIMSRSPEGARLLADLCTFVGTSPAEAAKLIPAVLPLDLKLTEDEIADFVSRTLSAGNYQNAPYVINEQEMAQIYRTLFT